LPSRLASTTPRARPLADVAGTGAQRQQSRHLGLKFVGVHVDVQLVLDGLDLGNRILQRIVYR